MECGICGAEMRCVGAENNGGSAVQRYACLNKNCPAGEKNLAGRRTKLEDGTDLTEKMEDTKHV